MDHHEGDLNSIKPECKIRNTFKIFTNYRL